MDYKKHYDLLVEKAKVKNVSQDEYYEIHHIVPRCMGGDDSSDNLVKLTAREHYVAHALLYYMHRTTKLAHAWFMMTRTSLSHNSNRDYTSRQYEEARKAHVAAMKTYTGEKNNFYGKTHSETSKDKIRKGQIDYRNKNPDEYAKIISKLKTTASKTFKGVPKSQEQRDKIGMKSKGHTTIKNIVTGECVRIPVDKVQEYDPTVWLSTYKAHRMSGKVVETTCPHCNKTGDSGNASFMKWHFNNCKKSPDYVYKKTTRTVVYNFWSPWLKKSKDNDIALEVYNKLFDIESIVNANIGRSTLHICNSVRKEFDFKPEQMYYIRTCVKAITTGLFCSKSKESLKTTMMR